MNAVGAWATWVTSAGGAAWAVSKTGVVVGAPASVRGVPIGGGAEWTGLATALEIASALADIGAPVWLPALKLWARSLGVWAVGACGAAKGLPAGGVVGASVLGLAPNADVVGDARDERPLAASGPGRLDGGVAAVRTLPDTDAVVAGLGTVAAGTLGAGTAAFPVGAFPIVGGAPVGDAASAFAVGAFSIAGDAALGDRAAAFVVGAFPLISSAGLLADWGVVAAGAFALSAGTCSGSNVAASAAALLGALACGPCTLVGAVWAGAFSWAPSPPSFSSTCCLNWSGSVAPAIPATTPFSVAKPCGDISNPWEAKTSRIAALMSPAQSAAATIACPLISITIAMISATLAGRGFCELFTSLIREFPPSASSLSLLRNSETVLCTAAYELLFTRFTSAM